MTELPSKEIINLVKWLKEKKALQVKIGVHPDTVVPATLMKAFFDGGYEVETSNVLEVGKIYFFDKETLRYSVGMEPNYVQSTTKAEQETKAGQVAESQQSEAVGRAGVRRRNGL